MTRKYYLLGLLGIIAGILIDQGTKMLAVAHLKGQEAILIIPNVFQLQYLENHGAAFGILQNKRGFSFSHYDMYSGCDHILLP